MPVVYYPRMGSNPCPFLGESQRLYHWWETALAAGVKPGDPYVFPDAFFAWKSDPYLDDPHESEEESVPLLPSYQVPGASDSVDLVSPGVSDTDSVDIDEEVATPKVRKTKKRRSSRSG